MFFNARGGAAPAAQSAPIASSIVIKSLADLQTQLAADIDEHIAAHPVLAPSKAKPDEAALAAWRGFPRDRTFGRARATERVGGCERGRDGERRRRRLRAFETRD